MRTFLILAIVVTIWPADEEPSLTATYPECDSMLLHQQLVIEIEVRLGSLPAQSEVELMALELHNLLEEHVEYRVQSIQTGPALTNVHLFRVTLSALDAGAAGVGDVQVAVTPPDQSEPIILQTQGFSMLVSRPFDWAEALLWLFLLLLTTAVAVAALLVFNWFVAARLRQSDTPENLEVTLRLREPEQLMLEGLWRKAAETAWALILAGTMEAEQTAPDRLRAERLSALAKRWPELPGAYRLGEEIKYGGYEPSRSEARYLLDTARKILTGTKPAGGKETDPQTSGGANAH